MSDYLRATVVALIAIAAVAIPGFAQAASGPNVTVQIEGVEATIVEKRDVVLDYNKFSPPAPWPGSSAPANSIGAAIETALNDTYGAPPTNGWWDREPFVSEVKGETLIWPKYWAFFTNNIYGNKGAMDGGDQWGLDYGDDLLISGGGSIGEWPEPSRPERLPVDLTSPGIEGAASVPVNTPFPVEVTAWMPQGEDTDMPPGPSVRQRASFPFPGNDFTVVAMPNGTLYDRNTVSGLEIGKAKTNSNGKGTLTISETGEALVKAVREDSSAAFGASPLGAQGRSEAHEVCVYELDTGNCDTPVLSATTIDAGEAAVDSVGRPAKLEVSAPNLGNTVSWVRVLGADAGDFLVSAGNCVDEYTVQGSSCPITVRLAPTAEGARSATLRIKSSTESLPRDVSLTGTGTAGPTPSGTPALSVRTNPTQARIRRAKAIQVTVRTTNNGDATATNVVTCLRLPNGFRAGRTCAKQPRLGVDATAAATFSVRATRQAPLGPLRNAQVRSTADGVGITTTQMKLGARR